MTDRYGRRLSYLRVSVTDRCNLRCRYCMPEDSVTSVPHGEVLSFDEITRLVGVMAGLGVNRVRLTGGEPLVRRGLPRLARDIKSISGIGFLGLTTNGVLLPPLAAELRAAGVDGINVSLDSLDPRRYQAITGQDALQAALAGLNTALEAGFAPVKVNCVLAPQSQPEDWLGVAGLARELPVDVRLIEWMPMAGEPEGGATRSDDALALLGQAYGPLRPQEAREGGGPARLWRIEGFKGRVGVIPAMTHNFCAGCNRLRLTATGDLKLCLFYDTGLPLKPLLRGGATDAQLAAAIEQSVQNKPRQHSGRVLTQEEGGACGRIDHAEGMYKTGG